jgi:hypothetical protein
VTPEGTELHVGPEHISADKLGHAYAGDVRAGRDASPSRLGELMGSQSGFLR